MRENREKVCLGAFEQQEGLVADAWGLAMLSLQWAGEGLQRRLLERRQAGRDKFSPPKTRVSQVRGIDPLYGNFWEKFSDVALIDLKHGVSSSRLKRRRQGPTPRIIPEVNLELGPSRPREGRIA